AGNTTAVDGLHNHDLVRDRCGTGVVVAGATGSGELELVTQPATAGVERGKAVGQGVTYGPRSHAPALVRVTTETTALFVGVTLRLVFQSARVGRTLIGPRAA